MEYMRSLFILACMGCSAVVGQYVAVIAIEKTEQWQDIVLTTSEFRNHAGDALPSWAGIQELKLSDAERLRPARGSSTKSRIVGKDWQGPRLQDHPSSVASRLGRQTRAAVSIGRTCPGTCAWILISNACAINLAMNRCRLCGQLHVPKQRLFTSDEIKFCAGATSDIGMVQNTRQVFHT